MPRSSKGPRLYLKPARRDGEAPLWIIRDGRRSISTGCGFGDRPNAERRLAEYIGRKYQPARRERVLSEIKLRDVISIYLKDVAPRQANIKKVGERGERLLKFFGSKTLDQVNGGLCREYVEWRGNDGGSRRDLQDLAAAINYHHKEGHHREVIRVVLPQAGPSRVRWLTRKEVARLLWVCLTTHELQRGQKTKKRPFHHLTRFITLGVYTGSRPGAILGLSWHQLIGSGYVDLDRGLIYRKAVGSRDTNKRQPPVPMAPQLLRLMRRWHRQDSQKGPVVRFSGKQVLSVKTALKRAVELAGLDTSVTAYSLRHTTASWLIQKGVSTRKVAEILGTSEAMIERHYGHLAPDHLRDEVAAIGRK
jgi:integrase